MVCETCGFTGSGRSCDLCGGKLVPDGKGANVHRERVSDDGERHSSFITGPAAVAQYDQSKAEALEHLREAHSFMLICEVWNEEEEEMVMRADVCSGAGSASDLPSNMLTLLSHAVSVAISSVANLAGELAIEEYRREHGK